MSQGSLLLILMAHLGSGGELMAFQVELFCGTETGGFMQVVHTV